MTSLEQLLKELETRATGSEDPWFNRLHILQLIEIIKAQKEALAKVVYDPDRDVAREAEARVEAIAKKGIE